MKREKFFLLGVSSFAGASMASFLINKKKIVYGTYRSNKAKPYLPFKYMETKNNKVNLIKIDLLKDNKKLFQIIKKVNPDYIIDFASISMVGESWINPRKYFNTNVLSKTDLISNLKKIKKLKKYIYISTPEVFGSSKNFIKETSNTFSPSTPYAASKLACEVLMKSYIKNFNTPIIIARFSNFYGPGQPAYRLISKIILSIKKKIKFPLDGKGTSLRNYIFSEDFCRGIFKIVRKGKNGNTYHFASNKLYSVKEIVLKICKIMNTNYKNLVISKKDRIGKDKIYKLNSNKTRKKLNWNMSVAFDRGIRKTINYINDNFDCIKKESMNFKLWKIFYLLNIIKIVN